MGFKVISVDCPAPSVLLRNKYVFVFKHVARYPLGPFLFSLVLQTVVKSNAEDAQCNALDFTELLR